MKKVLLLASHWPEPESSAAGSRTLQLLQLLLENDWKVVMMTAAGKRPHSADLPDEVQCLPLELNSSRMDEAFADLEPDLVWFDRFYMEEQYGWRIAQSCPNAKRMLDTIDLHSLRDIRQKAHQEGRERQIEDWFSESAMRELASIYRSDLTLMISESETRILTDELRVPERLLQTVPFLLGTEERKVPDDRRNFGERRDFVTIGNFNHPPNADSVRFLYQELWPRIRSACPKATLKVYGADCSDNIRQMHQPSKGFLIEGRADSAQDVLSKAKVCLAPLRFGAGLKGKLLDAMCAGTPSVTTTIGAEGMQGDHDWPGAVADDPDRFVESAITLYTDSDVWSNAHHCIQPLLEERFNREVLGVGFLDRLDSLMNERPGSNPDQMIGALLRHHQHRSTEFMSRWIEAKRKLGVED